MAGWSKLPPEITCLPCKHVAHPWTDNCLSAAMFTWVDSCFGSAKFFGFLYLCQYVSTVLKKKKKANFNSFLRMFIRSIAFAATVSATTFGTHCLLRRLLGRFHYLTVVFVPAFFGGCSIFLESRKGRELYVNTFANCVLELSIKLLEQSKVLTWNPNIQTVAFMIFSSLLSSLLSRSNFDSNYFWFFMPPKVKNDDTEGDCFHKGNCRNHIFGLFVMYSLTGLVLQFLRLFNHNLKNPKLFLLSLKNPKTFKLPGFLGGYVVIYQAIRCFLYQKKKKYSVIHDSLAGFLAGVTFRFQPTIAIFNSAVITIIQILTEACCQKKIIPNLPYLEILFPFFCGLLFHSQIFLTEHCPQLMVYIMSTVTHRMSDRGVLLSYENINPKLLVKEFLPRRQGEEMPKCLQLLEEQSASGII